MYCSNFAVKVTYWVSWISATEDTVLVQSGTKALVCAATSIKVILPGNQDTKAPSDMVISLLRKLLIDILNV